MILAILLRFTALALIGAGVGIHFGWLSGAGAVAAAWLFMPRETVTP